MVTDYEAVKAAEWENDSDTSTIRAPSPRPIPVTVVQSHATSNNTSPLSTQAAPPGNAGGRIAGYRPFTGTNSGRSSTLPRNNTTNGSPVAPAGLSQRPSAPSANLGLSNNHPGARFSHQSINRPGVNFLQNSNEGRNSSRAALTNISMNGKSDVPIKKYKPFVKGPRLITARGQEAQDRKKQEKVLAKKYVGQPEVGENMKDFGYYKLDDSEDFLLFGGNFEELDRIRQVLQVYVHYEAQSQQLIIRSAELKDMNGVLRAIQALVKELEAQNSGSAPRYLIHLPGAEDYRNNVTAADTRQGFDSGGNLIVLGVKMVGAPLIDTEKVLYMDTTYPDTLASNNRVYFQHVKKRLRELHSLKCPMTMRVRFGYVEITSYPQSLVHRGGMPLEEFSATVQNPRTRGAFQSRIGNLLRGEKMLKSIMKAKDVFTPSNYRLQDLEKVEPEWAFIVHVRTPNNGIFRIEGDVDRVYDGWGIGIARQQIRKKPRLNVSTLAVLDGELDFCHEVTQKLPLSDAEDHPAFASLIEKIKVAKAKLESDSRGVQYPRIAFLEDHLFRPGHELLEGDLKVETVVLRKLMVFALANDPSYRIEVDIARMWNSYKTTGDPDDTYCGASMYNYEWNAQLQEVSNVEAEHIWDPELLDFFPDGFDSFHEKVHEVRKVLSAASEED